MSFDRAQIVLVLLLLTAIVFLMYFARRERVRRRYVEHKMRRQSMAMQALMDTLPDPVWLKTSEGVYLDCNKAFAQFFARSPEQVIGCSDKELIDAELQSAISDFERQAVLRKESVESEHVLSHADGREVVLSAIRVAFQDTAGKVLGIVGVSRDITLRKKTEKMLVQAKEEAEQVVKAKSYFLTNMSHEIRGPMTSIIGASHLVLKTPLTLSQRDYLCRIQQAGQHMQGIINDVLDFSRTESGELVVQQIEFELAQVLDRVLRLVTDLAEQKELKVLFHLPEYLPNQLLGDPLRLRQILLNFANNAIKFTEQGEIEIDVRLVERQADRVILCFSIRDTGIGLTEEQQACLFESFQPFNRTVSHKEGSGLGLVLCKRLVEAMHGAVGAESIVGVGSRFWCQIPFTLANTASGADTQALDTLQVLIVDGDFVSCQLATGLLKLMHCGVLSTNNIEDTLYEVQSRFSTGKPIDLLLINWQTSCVNGLECARRIQELDKAERPYLLMLTEYYDEDLLVEARDAGVDDVLLKPLTAAQLQEAIAHYLAKGAAGG